MGRQAIGTIFTQPPHSRPEHLFIAFPLSRYKCLFLNIFKVYALKQSLLSLNCLSIILLKGINVVVESLFVINMKVKSLLILFVVFMRTTWHNGWTTIVCIQEPIPSSLQNFNVYATLLHAVLTKGNKTLSYICPNCRIISSSFTTL